MITPHWHYLGQPQSLFTEDWKSAKFGLVMIAPPSTKHFAMPRLRRERIFVIDTSGSMAGESIR